MRRNMEFIVQQQAQFTTDIQKLHEEQAETKKIVERLATLTLNRFERVEGEVANLESKMSALVDSHIKLADSQKNTDERMTALVDSHIKLADAQKNIDERMNALVDSHINLADAQKSLADTQKNSDERLNAFIATVERIISEGRNGK